MRAYVLVLFILMFTMAACSPGMWTEWTTQSGQALFFDDFSDPASGWDRTVNDGGIVGYDSGAYRILVNQPAMIYWSTPGLHLRDMRIEVDVAKYGGPDINRIGVICRYQDVANYYFFLISSDGFFAVGKMVNGESVLLGQDQMQHSPSINVGMAINHLRADCVDSSLTFYINFAPVALVYDEEFSAGDVGLLAGTFAETGADIIFDNFVVIKP